MPAAAVEDWTECAQTHTQTDRQTDRQTDKSETVYPPVSLRLLGGYKNRKNLINITIWESWV